MSRVPPSLERSHHDLPCLPCDHDLPWLLKQERQRSRTRKNEHGAKKRGKHAALPPKPPEINENPLPSNKCTASSNKCLTGSNKKHHDPTIGLEGSRTPSPPARGAGAGARADPRTSVPVRRCRCFLCVKLDHTYLISRPAKGKLLNIITI